MKNKTVLPLLMVDGSQHNGDMFYATKFLAWDPFVYLRLPSDDILYVSSMEYERAEKESCVKEIRSLSDYGYKIKRHERIANILAEEKLTSIEVPRYFSLYLADELRKKGIDVLPAEDLIMTKEREIKDEVEIASIRKVQLACEHAMNSAITIIKQSSIKNDCLMNDGKILTSERIRTYIEYALFDMGCESSVGDPIVACRKQAADPHCRGYGPLHANEPIIIDICPQSKSERYFADMTRTVVNGKPSNKIQEMFDVVAYAQIAALDLVKEGTNCAEIHNLVCDIFEESGFGTIRTKSKTGFIHDTGHGVGLDIHEMPDVADFDYVLREGNVITLEPGLYDPEVGGVRLEDLVVVRKNGCENLTRLEKRL